MSLQMGASEPVYEIRPGPGPGPGPLAVSTGNFRVRIDRGHVDG